MPLHTRQPAVLVVDDDSLVLDLIVAFLGDHYTLSLATDARDGLVRFSRRSFDAVIVDRAMPQLLGDHFALQIKEQSPQIPIILITGFHGAPIDTKLFASILHKPFTQDQLLDALRDALLTADT